MGWYRKVGLARQNGVADDGGVVRSSWEVAIAGVIHAYKV